MSRADEMKEIDDVFNTHSIEVERTHDCNGAEEYHDAVDETGGYSFDEAITMALAAIDAPCDCGTCRAIAADRLTRGKEG